MGIAGEGDFEPEPDQPLPAGIFSLQDTIAEHLVEGIKQPDALHFRPVAVEDDHSIRRRITC